MPVAAAPGSEALPDGNILPSGYNTSNTTAAIMPPSQRPPSPAAQPELAEQLARDELEARTRGELEEARERGVLEARDE